MIGLHVRPAAHPCISSDARLIPILVTVSSGRRSGASIAKKKSSAAPIKTAIRTFRRASSRSDVGIGGSQANREAGSMGISCSNHWRGCRVITPTRWRRCGVCWQRFWHHWPWGYAFMCWTKVQCRASRKNENLVVPVAATD